MEQCQYVTIRFFFPNLRFSIIRKLVTPGEFTAEKKNRSENMNENLASYGTQAYSVRYRFTIIATLPLHVSKGFDRFKLNFELDFWAMTHHFELKNVHSEKPAFRGQLHRVTPLNLAPYLTCVGDACVCFDMEYFQEELFKLT